MAAPSVGLRPSIYKMIPTLFWGSPFNEEITDILRGARSVAVNVLGPRDDYEKQTFLYRAKGPGRKIKFKAHKVLFLQFGRDSDMDTAGVGFAARWIVGVASVLLGNVTAPMSGEDLSIRRVAVSELNRISSELESIQKYRQVQRRDTVAKVVTELLMHEQKVFSILKRNAEIVLALRIFLLLSAGVALMGAVTGSSHFIVAGTVGLFVSTSVVLVKAGFDSSYYHVRKEAKEMRRYVDYLLGVHWLTGGSSEYYPAGHE